MASIVTKTQDLLCGRWTMKIPSLPGVMSRVENKPPANRQHATARGMKRGGKKCETRKGKEKEKNKEKEREKKKYQEREKEKEKGVKTVTRA